MNSILAPFTYIIRTIFEIAFQLTGNYGVSVILLSFVISLLLLPIFIYIEKAKKRDDVLKNRMQPLINEIKQVYSGQERFYYLKTLNRQFGYSQFKALIPILSLLVQIPFFIAAYQYLNTLEALEEVSFGPLTDLSAPDGLLGVVNVLPILMTIINLVTVYFYSRNGSKSERIQMSVVAGIFLVLLFNLPSGLVLYWTMNNVFAFLRLFITNKEVFSGRISVRFKKTNTLLFLFVLCCTSLFVSQINWAIGHGFASLPLRLVISAIASLILVAILALLWTDYRFEVYSIFKQKKKIYLRWLHITLPLSVILNIIGYTVFNNDNYLNNTLISLGICLAFIILYQLFVLPVRAIISTLTRFPIPARIPLLFFVIGLYFFLSYNSHQELGNSILLYAAFGSTLIAQLIYSLHIYQQKFSFKVLSGFILIVISLLTLMQLLYVVAFFSATPLEINIFNINIKLLTNQICEELTKIGLSISGFTFLFTITDFKKISNETRFTNLVLTIITVVFITALVFFWHPLMVYASLPSEFTFNAVDIFTENFNFFVIIFASLFSFYLIVPQDYKRLVILAYLVALALGFINSIVIPLDLGSLQIDKYSKEQNLVAPLFAYILELGLLLGLAYSFGLILRKGQSKYLAIAICCLHFLVAAQALYKVYRPLTSVESNSPSISNEQASRFNKKDKDLPKKIMFSKTEKNLLFILADGIQGALIEQMMEENSNLKHSYQGFTWYPNTISVSNYTHTSVPIIMSGTSYYVDSLNANTEHTVRHKITQAANSFINKVHEHGYVMSSTHMHYSRANYNLIENYIPEWSTMIDELALKNGYKLKTFEVWYNRLWENALLYCSPLFLKASVYNNSKWIIQSDEVSQNPDKYNYLKLLVKLSDASSEKANFIYLHNHSGHNPWNTLSDEGTFKTDVHPYDNNLWVMQEYAKLFNWMRKEEVYDNTKIIIVSDHGVSWKLSGGKLPLEQPKNWSKVAEETLNLNQYKFWRLNALLLIKDYNKNAVFAKDTMLMTNADASYIAFNDSYIDSLKVFDERSVKSFYVNWKGSFAKFKEHPINDTYIIKNDIYDLNNWTRVK